MSPMFEVELLRLSAQQQPIERTPTLQPQYIFIRAGISKAAKAAVVLGFVAASGYALLGCTGTADAANVAYGEFYEQAYLATCMATDTAQACSCMMEAIQTEISFAVFADLVAFHSGQIGRDIQHASVIEAARRRCVSVTAQRTELLRTTSDGTAR